MSNDHRAPKKNRYTVALESGKHYYFAVWNDVYNALIVQEIRPKLEPVSCQDAVIEAVKAKPLNPKKTPANLSSTRAADSGKFPTSCDDAADVPSSNPAPNGAAH